MTQAEAEAAVGWPIDAWDGRCHAVSSSLAPLLGGVVHRGYFTGKTVEGAFFHGQFAQHSWIALPDGRVCDPTRHAFTLDDRWPLWVGTDDEYDVGGCRSQPPLGRPPETSGPLCDVTVSSTTLQATGLAYVLPPDRISDTVASLTRAEISWLAHLPVRDGYGLGVLPRKHAAEVYQAVIDAGHGELIPIDRRHWILGKDDA